MFRHALIQLLTAVNLIGICTSSNILMITMGGTKSHKIPFWELARGLTARGHNITFISGFTADAIMPGVDEITPASLVFYIKNFTNWDLMGNRMRGEEPVSPLDILRYPFQKHHSGGEIHLSAILVMGGQLVKKFGNKWHFRQDNIFGGCTCSVSFKRIFSTISQFKSCEMLLSDPETKDFLRSQHSYDLLVLDGAFPECALGFAYYFKAPYIYINTVGFYVGSLSLAGNPVPFSVTPFLGRGFTDSMTFHDRILNTAFYVGTNFAHRVVIEFFVQQVLRKHFGTGIPGAYEMSKNVSFILQNAHVSVSYPRPYLPNVAEVACLHCKPSKPLPKDLDEFINGGDDNGFIYVSMGSSVRADNMPEYLRFMFIRVFEQLPYRVLWKWESVMNDLPENVKISRWLPQQDLLGHKKIRAFVTHGGLLSMFETVYHGVPVVTMPVFCDHDANAAKAELDGYAVKLELRTITAEELLWSIKRVIHDPKYRAEVKKRQILLRDQKESPLERAVYWTEYVLRHNGAYHLQSPAKDLSVLQYYLVDIVALAVILFIIISVIGFYLTKLFFNWLTNSNNMTISVVQNKKKD